jgi:hypothetical protein
MFAMMKTKVFDVLYKIFAMMADSNCSVALYAGFELAIQIQTSTAFLEKN